MIIIDKTCVVLALCLLLTSGQSAALTTAALNGAALTSTALNSAAAEPWQFRPESEVVAQLPVLEQQAATANKLLLVVLGANWCHDSVKLLERFNQPEMAQALTARFNMAFVDVAYLEFGKTTAQRYQLPHYYGTPTVLIIEPKTRQLLNKTDVMHWTNAASFDVAAYQQYFLHSNFVQQFEKEQQQLSGINPQQLLQINQFEQQQAAQLALAYQHIGPLLKSYKTSGKPASREFKKLWDEVKVFRNNILPTVKQLQQHAKVGAADKPLVLPERVAFSFALPPGQSD